jgi:hypothetical protein
MRLHEKLINSHTFEAETIEKSQKNQDMLSQLNDLVRGGGVRNFLAKMAAGENNNVESFKELDAFLRNVKLLASANDSHLQTAVAALTVCDNWLQVMFIDRTTIHYTQVM